MRTKSHDDVQLMLEAYEANFNNGERIALTDALALCCREEIVPPVWVRSAYLGAYRAVRSFEVSSWDEVFGKPNKGRKVTALRKEREIRWEIVQRVTELRKGAHRGDVFEIVAGELHISRGTCKRYFDNVHRFRKVRR